MRKTRVTFSSGKLSLEGVLSIPSGIPPFPAVIVCHPHPLYGGSMDNNVVYSLCDSLAQASIISLRFNFRGVGESQGEHSQGIGEQEDVSSAISYIAGVNEADPEKIGIAGYSAGAGFCFPVACRDERIKAMAAISPPLSMYDFSLLKSCSKPKLLLCGSQDNFTPVAQFLGFCRSLPEPQDCESVDGADHFWWGFEATLAGKIASFFAKVL